VIITHVVVRSRVIREVMIYCVCIYLYRVRPCVRALIVAIIVTEGDKMIMIPSLCYDREQQHRTHAEYACYYGDD